MPETIGSDVVGYQVEAVDGTIGKITDADQACLTVKPGFLRKRHLIPSIAVDRPHHRVRVGMTKQQIAESPRPQDFGFGDGHSNGGHSASPEAPPDMGTLGRGF